jgi:uncharacterized membrane protein
MKNSNDPNVVAQYYQDFTATPDIAAVNWLNNYRAAGRSICADEFARLNVFTSYGGFPSNGQAINVIPQACKFSASYIYLSEHNNVQGVIYSAFNPPVAGTTSSISPKLTVKNRIYSDGAAIYD